MGKQLRLTASPVPMNPEQVQLQARDMQAGRGWASQSQGYRLLGCVRPGAC